MLCVVQSQNEWEIAGVGLNGETRVKVEERVRLVRLVVFGRATQFVLANFIWRGWFGPQDLVLHVARWR